MILLVLLIGGGLGWLVRGAKIQRNAVAAIEAANGSVVYEWNCDPESGRPRDPNSTRGRWMKWLVDRVGVDYVSNVVSVTVRDRRTGGGNVDAVMEHVGRLDRLVYLNLMGCETFTNAGLARVRHLTRLRFLGLNSTGVDGAGLRHLEGMKELRRLELPPRPLGDADLAPLAQLTTLEHLHGDECHQVTDAGLMHLRGLTNLKSLSLESAPITAEGLAALRDMGRLESLDLSRSAVSDLAPIRHLTGLKTLRLDSTPMDDAGLAPIASLTRLESLTLARTRVTDAGLEHLRGLSALSTLNLRELSVGDAGMAAVGTLTDLKELDISETAVGDAGLARFSGLGKLTRLWAVRTRITDAGLAHLPWPKQPSEEVYVSGPGITDAGLARAGQNRPGSTIQRVR